MQKCENQGAKGTPKSPKFVTDEAEDDYLDLQVVPFFDL